MSKEPSNKQEQEQERDQLIEELTAIAEDPTVLEEAAELAREIGTIPPEQLQ